MSEKQQQEFIESLEGKLSPEQAAQLLELEGDTDATAPDEETAPAVPPAKGKDESNGEAEGSDKDGGDKGSEVDESTLTPENAVILARDGKHTISFDKLMDARKGEQYWRERYEALASRQEDAQARAEAGIRPTVADNQVAAVQAAINQGVDISIFGDFSEEAMAKGLSELVDQRVDAKVNAVLSQKLQPLMQQQAMTAQQEHEAAIYAAHPDADSIVESKELADWILAQPKILHGAYKTVLESGSAQEIIEVFDAFKKATDVTQETVQTPDLNKVREAAKKAVSAAPRSVPTSLTEFPGGRPAGKTRTEQLAEIENGAEMLAAMENMDMNPEQLHQFLNRI